MSTWRTGLESYSPADQKAVDTTAEWLAAEAEVVRLRELLGRCLIYFSEFDAARADGRTSPIIPDITAALDAVGAAPTSTSFPPSQRGTE